MNDCQGERKIGIIEGCSCYDCDPCGAANILVWDTLYQWVRREYDSSPEERDINDLEHKIRVALLLEKGSKSCESSAGSLVVDTDGFVEKLAVAVAEKLVTTTSLCESTQNVQSESSSNGKWEVVRFTPGTDYENDEVVLTLGNGRDAREASIALTRAYSNYYYIRQVGSEIDF